jgi:hypothetical protein
MYAYALVHGAVLAPVERESSGGQQLIKHTPTKWQNQAGISSSKAKPDNSVLELLLWFHIL